MVSSFSTTHTVANSMNRWYLQQLVYSGFAISVVCLSEVPGAAVVATKAEGSRNAGRKLPPINGASFAANATKATIRAITMNGWFSD